MKNHEQEIKHMESKLKGLKISGFMYMDRFSQIDNQRYNQVYSRIGELVHFNTYNNNFEEIETIYGKGINIIRKILMKYGANAEEISDHGIETMQSKLVEKLGLMLQDQEIERLIRPRNENLEWVIETSDGEIIQMPSEQEKEYILREIMERGKLQNFIKNVKPEDFI